MSVPIPIAGPAGSDGPHVFVEDLARPALDEHDRHHLAKVLRTRPGDSLTASDGRGSWVRCRFGAEIEVVDEVQHVPASTPELTIGFAVLKGGRPELVVQKLTELGVDAIGAFTAERSVVRWDDDKVGSQQQRWERVAREAAMQSRRVRLPRIDAVVGFDAAVTSETHLAQPGGPAPSAAVTSVMVGPEGGFSERELAAAPTVGLGPQVLRAETAAIVAGAILAGLRAGVVRSAH